MAVASYDTKYKSIEVAINVSSVEKTEFDNGHRMDFWGRKTFTNDHSTRHYLEVFFSPLNMKACKNHLKPIVYQ